MSTDGGTCPGSMPFSSRKAFAFWPILRRFFRRHRRTWSPRNYFRFSFSGSPPISSSRSGQPQPPRRHRAESSRGSLVRSRRILSSIPRLTSGGFEQSREGNSRQDGVPTGIRTRVSALKGPRPRPLDDGDGMSALGVTFTDRRTHYCDTATGTRARARILGRRGLFPHSPAIYQ